MKQKILKRKKIIEMAFASNKLFDEQLKDKLNLLETPLNSLRIIQLNLEELISPIVELTKNIDYSSFEKFGEEFGWLEFISISYALKLEKVLKQEGEKKVWQKLIEDLNNPGLIKTFSEDIAKVKLIEERLHLLNKALEHHKNKDYISAIPLLLSQIEGIIWDLGAYKKIVEPKLNSQYKIDINGNCVLDSRGKRIEWRLGEILQYLFGKKSKLVNHTKENVYSKELRHPVLHGRRTDYNEPQDSTMLVLLLLTIIERVKDETRNEVQTN